MNRILFTLALFTASLARAETYNFVADGKNSAKGMSADKLKRTFFKLNEIAKPTVKKPRRAVEILSAAIFSRSLIVYVIAADFTSGKVLPLSREARRGLRQK